MRGNDESVTPKTADRIREVAMDREAKGTPARCDSGSVKRSVTITLSRFAFEGLIGQHGDGGKHSDRSAAAPDEMERAIRFYLGDRGCGRPAWPYPGFLRESEVQDDVALEASIDEELWRAFEAESGSQGVTVRQLSEHAAIYFVAEMDAGRITQRILADLESTDVADRSKH